MELLSWHFLLRENEGMSVEQRDPRGGWKSELLSLLKIDPPNFDLEKVVDHKESFLPQKLYRYRPVSNFEIELKNLDQSFVWLSNPKDYNDPFDSLVHFSDSIVFGRLNEEMVSRFSGTMKTPLKPEQIQAIVQSKQGIKELLVLAAREHQEMTEEQQNEAIRKLTEFAYSRYLEMLELLNQIIRQGALVCSFSERSDSTLMWSHYSANHEGFCVEYSFGDLPKGSEIRKALYPVIYNENLTDVSEQFQARTGDKKGIGLLACVSKAKDWEYEKEWRLILLLRPNAPGREWKMPQPTKILLGARIKEPHEKRILEIAAKNGINVSRMALSRDSYRMTEKDLS